jgi:5-methylcytosine-specific restriction endonuclease McrA
MAVLLLNATFEPLRVITAKRAVVLLLQEKAEVIHEGDDEWRSASLAIKVPQVIRLKYFVQIPFRSKTPLTNAAVLVRDGRTCAYCQKRKATTVDHIVPRSRGGRHEWSNVIAACRPCNARKADKLLSELGWQLPFEPRIPHGSMWLLVGLREPSEVWTPYLTPAV